MLATTALHHFDLRSVAVHASQLPPAPQVFGRLLAAIHDGNSSLQNIAGLVQLDPSLVSQLLRVANSAIFAFRVPAGSVEEAVLRVGLKEVHRIVGLSAASLIFRADLVVYGTTAWSLWENAAVNALAMDLLAHRTFNEPSMAYTTGLLRSVGKMVLARHAFTVNGVVPYVDDGTVLSDWERANFSVTHAEVGAALCDAWRFPPAIGAAIRDHLEPSANPEATVLAYLLNAAGQIATNLGHGLPGEAPLWAGDPARFKKSDLRHEDLAGLTIEVADAFERMQEMLALIRRA